jgi:hypothetical protein
MSDLIASVFLGRGAPANPPSARGFVSGSGHVGRMRRQSEMPNGMIPYSGASWRGGGHGRGRRRSKPLFGHAPIQRQGGPLSSSSWAYPLGSGTGPNAAKVLRRAFEYDCATRARARVPAQVIAFSASNHSPRLFPLNTPDEHGRWRSASRGCKARAGVSFGLSDTSRCIRPFRFTGHHRIARRALIHGLQFMPGPPAAFA